MTMNQNWRGEFEKKFPFEFYEGKTPHNLVPQAAPSTKKAILAFIESVEREAEKRAEDKNLRNIGKWVEEARELGYERGSQDAIFGEEHRPSWRKKWNEEGAKHALEELRGEVKAWQEAYPITIFSAPWDGWQKDVDELAKKHGKRIDNVSAEYNRRAEKIWKEEFINLLDTKIKEYEK